MARYIFFGIVFYVVFLIASLPAALVYGHWKQYLGGDVPFVMQGIGGSIWSGNAATVTISNQPIQKVNWRFKPWQLLLGNAELAIEFSMQDGYGKGTVGYNVLGSVYANNLDAWLPMDQVLPLFNLGSLRPGGSLAVNMSELEVDKQTLSNALGSLVWQDAEITILKPMPLGSLKIDLEPTPEGIKGVISDMGGPLQADGLLTVSSDGKYNFSGEVAVRDPQQKDLQNAIRSMGRMDKSGKVKLSQSGDLAKLGLL